MEEWKTLKWFVLWASFADWILSAIAFRVGKGSAKLFAGIAWGLCGLSYYFSAVDLSIRGGAHLE